MKQFTDRQREVLQKMSEGWELRRYASLHIAEKFSMLDTDKRYRFNVPHVVRDDLLLEGLIKSYEWLDINTEIYQLTEKGREVIK
jgi:hypothetical protein